MNHMMPASNLPWIHVQLEKAQEVRASGSSLDVTLALPTICPAFKGHPKLSGSQSAHAVPSPHAFAFASPSTWNACPSSPGPAPGVEWGSPALCPTVPLLGHLWL